MYALDADFRPTGAALVGGMICDGRVVGDSAVAASSDTGELFPARDGEVSPLGIVSF